MANETPKPINPEFTVHLLNDDGISKAKQLATEFNNILEYLKTVCPQGREFSIVKTKLEEACFFAKKAVAGDPINHK